MQPEALLQQLATGPYPKLDDASPFPRTRFSVS